MEAKGTIEKETFTPNVGTDSTMVLEVRLDNTNELITVTDNNNEATLIKKYDFTVKGGNHYNTSSIYGRRCLIFRNNEGDAFIEYI